MTKRYAPPAPDPTLHRPNDTPYFFELINAIGLTQRGLAPLLGVNERTIRKKFARESPWTYPEQFTLETIIDAKLREQDAAPTYESAPEPRTAWHRVADRRLTAVDVGKMVVGKDRFGSPVHGILSRDGFGVVIKSVDGLDVRNIPVDRVELYALLDPPPG